MIEFRDIMLSLTNIFLSESQLIDLITQNLGTYSIIKTIYYFQS